MSNCHQDAKRKHVQTSRFYILDNINHSNYLDPQSVSNKMQEIKNNNIKVSPFFQPAWAWSWSHTRSHRGHKPRRPTKSRAWSEPLFTSILLQWSSLDHWALQCKHEQKRRICLGVYILIDFGIFWSCLLPETCIYTTSAQRKKVLRFRHQQPLLACSVPSLSKSRVEILRRHHSWTLTVPTSQRFHHSQKCEISPDWGQDILQDKLVEDVLPKSDTQLCTSYPNSHFSSLQASHMTAAKLANEIQLVTSQTCKNHSFSKTDTSKKEEVNWCKLGR